MFFRAISKRSLLSRVFNRDFNICQFHFTSNNSIRKLVSKSSSNEFETEYFEENVNPELPQQNCNVNFLGIESDEGVIFIDTNKNTEFGLKTPVINVRKSKEKFSKASFGIIREDSDNKLNFHGQYGNNIDSDFPHKSTETSYVYAKYPKVKLKSFNLYQENKPVFNPSNVSEELSGKNFHNTTNSCQIERNDHNFKGNHEMSYIDECFFGNANVTNNSDNTSFTVNENPIEELGYIDKRFFGTDVTKNNFEHSTVVANMANNELIESSFIDKEICETDLVSGDCSPKNEDIIVDGNITKNESDEFGFIDKEFYNKLISNNITHHNDLLKNENKPIGIKNNLMHNLKASSFPSYLSSNTMKQNSFINATENNIPVDIEDSYFRNLHKSNNVQSSDSTIKQQSTDPLSQNEENIENWNVELNGHRRSKLSKHKSFEEGNKFIQEKDVRAIEKIYPNKMSTSDKSTDLSQVNTAEEFVMKLRSKIGVQKQNIKKVHPLNAELQDSKGFRILKNQVPDLSYVTKDEIITMLRNNILYSDGDLMVLNKPYNLVIHDSKTTSSLCLSQLLDDFAKITDLQTADPKLYTVHRIDKETTGCLLLARNEMAADKLKSLFSQRKIIKKYWIVTSGVPDPLKGVIDIPIAEGSIHNKKRMVLHPKLPKEIEYRNHSKNGKRAVTTYQVISISGNAALVEVITETGLKHQIRVHFGFGLSCPILGDHKYSHLDKMAPQKLQSDLLQKLHVRQAKVRHIPMHLHAHSITIPGYLDGRDLFVSAPLPFHMVANMKRLKFKKRNKLKL